MTVENAVIGLMRDASAITNVTSTRIYNGDRLPRSTLPAITVYRRSGVRRAGMESTSYTINCRATTAATALQMARLVTNLFGGSSGTGVYADISSFGIARASVDRDQGLISDPDEKAYLVPVEILIISPASSAS